MKALALAAAAVLTLGSSAQAQSDYPNKPVKIINDSAAGSATDVATRLMAERLSQVWGQQTIVETLADPAVVQRLKDIGQDIWPRDKQTPEALAAQQKNEIAVWWPIIKANNIKGE